MIASLIILIFLNVLDGVSSYIALQEFPNALGEGNSFAFACMRVIGVIPTIILFKVLAIMLAFCVVIALLPIVFKIILLTATSLHLGWTVTNNFKLINKYRKL
jgi:hypothetical protein